MDPSRNFLLGVLALRAGLIDPETFAAACHRWFRHQETPLADVLRERAGLTAADLEHVEYFVERAVTRHGGEARAARRAVDEMLARSAEEQLGPGPDLHPLRKQLLEEALKFHEAKVKEPADKPESKAELADAYRRLALIHERLGQPEEALKACRQA